MPVSAWVYAAVFASSLALALGFTPLALRFATWRHLLDHPGGHKTHERATPYLGGVAIAGAFAIAVMVAGVIHRPSSGLGELALVLSLALGLSVVGLLDDLRGLGVTVRFGAQVFAGTALWWFGSGVHLFSDEPLNLLVTLLWVVGITNAFNLLDNMDGLSAGVASIVALSFFVVAVSNGQFLVAALGLALAGCALGFLRHNFHPARIYMGDSGSLFLGFLLAYLGIKLRFKGPTYVTFFVPITVLGMAILDTTLVMITRLMHGRNPLLGGRDHISHRLVFVGIPVPYAVALIYGATLAHGWLGLAISRVDVATGFILGGFVLTADVFLMILLAQVPVYETSRRRHLMLQEVANHEPKVTV